MSWTGVGVLWFFVSIVSYGIIFIVENVRFASGIGTGHEVPCIIAMDGLV
jgi:hypothetical protein